MWIELHESARQHPKVLGLSRDLAVTWPTAFGYACALWTWTLTMAPDGNLSSFEPEDVEFGCGWNGEPKALFEAREACRRAAELIRRYATAGDLVTAEPDRDMIDAGLMELVHELTRRAVQYS